MLYILVSIVLEAKEFLLLLLLLSLDCFFSSSFDSFITSFLFEIYFFALFWNTLAFFGFALSDIKYIEPLFLLLIFLFTSLFCLFNLFTLLFTPSLFLEIFSWFTCLISTFSFSFGFSGSESLGLSSSGILHFFNNEFNLFKISFWFFDIFVFCLWNNFLVCWYLFML